MVKRVFISYAHESKELSDLVLNFSDYLRLRGVDSEIDQYEESPPEGWPKWMSRQIQQADYVLVVCSALFYERYNDCSGVSSGLGVKWETNLISQQLYELNSNNTKFIPILFEDKSKDYIPLPLRAYTHYCINDDNVDEKEKLTNRLLGISKSKRPALGSAYVKDEITPLDSKERKTLFIGDLINRDLWKEADWQGMAFGFMSNKLPVFGFMFSNEQYGNQIFKNLKENLGDYDQNARLRICVVENVSEKNPFYYRVHISSDWKFFHNEIKRLKVDQASILIGSQIQEIQSQSNQGLLLFKEYYEKHKKYYITNLKKNGETNPVPNLDNLICLDRIEFREKKDIINNNNDLDIVCFPDEI